MLKRLSVCLTFVLSLSAIAIHAQNGTPPKPPDVHQSTRVQLFRPAGAESLEGGAGGRIGARGAYIRPRLNPGVDKGTG